MSEDRVTVNQRGGLTWKCDECRAECDDDGAIFIHMIEYHKAADAMAEWDTFEFTKRREATEKAEAAGEPYHGWEATLMSELPDPEHGTWVVGCKRHIPANHYYLIDLDRADTPYKLLNWTAHLSSKNWTEYTDWDDLIRMVAHAGGGDA